MHWIGFGVTGGLLVTAVFLVRRDYQSGEELSRLTVAAV